MSTRPHDLTNDNKLCLLLLSTPGADYVTDVAPRVRALHIAYGKRVVTANWRPAWKGASIGTDPLNIEGCLTFDPTGEGDSRPRGEGDDAGWHIDLGQLF